MLLPTLKVPFVTLRHCFYLSMVAKRWRSLSFLFLKREQDKDPWKCSTFRKGSRKSWLSMRMSAEKNL